MAKLQKQLEVVATLDHLTVVQGFVEENLEMCECPMKVVMQITLALEEIFVNIASYAYTTGVGTCRIDLQIDYENENGTMQLLLCDKGMPFNPLEKEDPDVTLSAEDREIGGLGIYMVKKSMDQVSYEFNNGENQLKIVKSW